MKSFRWLLVIMGVLLQASNIFAGKVVIDDCTIEGEDDYPPFAIYVSKDQLRAFGYINYEFKDRADGLSSFSFVSSTGEDFSRGLNEVSFTLYAKTGSFNHLFEWMFREELRPYLLGYSWSDSYHEMRLKFDLSQPDGWDSFRYFVRTILWHHVNLSDRIRADLVRRLEPVSLAQENCSICLDSLDSKFSWNTICHHWFHRECMKKWRAIKKSCPQCNQNL